MNLQITHLGRCFGRDMILVASESVRQPFYRSTGINSHRPGVWLPFDGVRARVLRDRLRAWIDKSRFCQCEEYDYLFRFGTAVNREISASIESCGIPELPEVRPSEINRLLGFTQPDTLLVLFGAEAIDRVIDEDATRYNAEHAPSFAILG